jgi:hypothetical protein
MNQIVDENLTLPTQDIAAHVEICRAGFQATATDMLEFAASQGVENAAAAVLSGSLEAAVQMWVQTMQGIGHPPSRIRESLFDQIKTYHRKYAK